MNRILKENTNYFLIFIILLAAFLRFFQLGVNPPSLTWDEAAWGYNAYTLGIDGRDEFGRLLPYDYLESFGDFKPPMYAYLSIIPVKVFGLNEFSTRFSSAFFGTLTVLITYFLALSIFNSGKSKNKALPDSSVFAISTALFLAISPWHIMLSRAAFEANVATFFIVAGVWLFLMAIYKKPAVLPLAVISFIASVYTFNSARIVAPLLLFLLSLFFIRKLLNHKKIFFASVLIGALLILPILSFLASPQASLRYKEVNIFSDSELIRESNQQVLNDDNAWWSRIIHNRRVIYGREFIKHYFDNLSPNFLFVTGDKNPKFSTQDTGQMYLWDLPFLLAGLLFLFRKREKNWWIAPSWILIGIIPAAFARETPHALRIEGALVAFLIVSGYGFYQFLIWLSSSKNMLFKYRRQIASVSMLALFFSLFYFMHGYMIHYPRETSAEWQYGYKESISYLNQVSQKYDNIIFSDVLGRPYIYLLFYSKFDPQQFRDVAQIDRDVFGFVHVNKIGKYIFPDAVFKPDIPQGKNLYFENPEKIPVNAKVLKDFYWLNGKKAISAYTYAE